jgi:hypothetical protein
VHPHALPFNCLRMDVNEARERARGRRMIHLPSCMPRIAVWQRRHCHWAWKQEIFIRSHASQSSELVPSASFSWIPVTGYSRRQALQDFDQNRPCQHAHERRGWHKHREFHEWRSRWMSDQARVNPPSDVFCLNHLPPISDCQLRRY